MAEEKVVRIRVLAVADPSLKSAFVPFEQAATRARQRADRSIASNSREVGYRQNAYQADERMHSASEARKLRTQEMNARYLERVKTNTMLREQREQERAEAKAHRVRESRNRDFGKSVGRGVMRAAGAGIGAVGDAARGAGIDFSVGTLMQRMIAAEQTIIAASNSGMLAKGKVATKEDIATTSSAVDSAAVGTRRSREETASALEAFVSKSSDLELGRSILLDLGKTANATKSDFTELATAAGILSANMGDVPNKADLVSRAIRLMAQQGAKGTVEIKDLAVMMPRLAAGARAYGGDYETNLGNLGAVAQLAMLGGRVGPAEATNTSQSVGRDLTKAKTAKKFADAKIALFVDQEGKATTQETTNTKLRSVEDLMVDVLKYTKGDQLKIAALMPNQVSNAAAKSLTSFYLEGEKKQKGGGGEAAIRAEFARMRGLVSTEQINAMALNYEDSTGGKAQDLQNKAEGLFAGGFSKLMSDPGSLITGIGNMLGSENGIAAAMVAGAGGGGAANPLTTIAALAITTATIGSMIVNEMGKKHDAEEGAALRLRTEAGNARSVGMMSDDPEVIARAKAELEKVRDQQAELARTTTVQGLTGDLAGVPGMGALNFLAPNLIPNSSTQENASQGHKDTVAAINALNERLNSIKPPSAAEIGTAVGAAVGNGGPPIGPGRDLPSRPGGRT